MHLLHWSVVVASTHADTIDRTSTLHLRYVMAEIIFVIIGVTAGTGLLFGSIVTTYYCCKRHRRSSPPSPYHLSKPPQPDDDYLHSVIINQHIARHLRPQSTISFISDQYHHDMTLMAPPRRLALLEQQQQLQPSGTLIFENPLTSLPETRSVNDHSSAYAYENRSLELGELPTITSAQV